MMERYPTTLDPSSLRRSREMEETTEAIKGASLVYNSEDKSRSMVF
jgi:hypothetical protein